MRPVDKVLPGTVVTYEDSNGNVVQHTVQSDYLEYGDAKLPLSGNIGTYCSYCENKLQIANLAVEHLTAKARGGSVMAWNNFLLSCTVCNSVKNSRVLAPGMHWPHLNNTYLDFIYDDTGRVSINPNLPAASKPNAQALADVLRLQRYPGTADPPTPKDFRWKDRLEAWHVAERNKVLYQKGSITVDDVLVNAKLKGQWSVWFAVFDGVDEVRARLISDFEGTCSKCFDSSCGYKPVFRNFGSSDPV